MDPTTDLLTDRYGAPKYAGQRMDKTDFLRWESDDNYVYEYNDCILEPKKVGIWKKGGLANTVINVAPGFVVLFDFGSDNVGLSITRRHEYFNNGVQVIWWVYPEFKEVYVYTSPKAVTIFTDDVLSAAPALPDLQMTVTELFRR